MLTGLRNAIQFPISSSRWKEWILDHLRTIFSYNLEWACRAWPCSAEYLLSTAALRISESLSPSCMGSFTNHKTKKPLQSQVNHLVGGTCQLIQKSLEKPGSAAWLLSHIMSPDLPRAKPCWDTPPPKELPCLTPFDLIK